MTKPQPSIPAFSKTGEPETITRSQTEEYGNYDPGVIAAETVPRCWRSNRLSQSYTVK